MMEGKKGVVALLDEVDKADPSLWAPLLGVHPVPIYQRHSVA